MRRVSWCCLFVLLLTVEGAASAQSARDARLTVTVTDPSGAVLPGATVTVTGLDDATKIVTTAPAKASDKGVAGIDGLAPGRYAIHASYAGFADGLLKDIRLRSGDNKHVIVLPLRGVQDAVSVVQSAQQAAADPRGSAFRTILTPEDIQALSDDPAEMAQQLLDIAGGNAVFKIDSFIGGALPPKAMIKSVHIVRDTFSAENHSAESDQIEIITQPGVGSLRGAATTRLRDGALSARSPFTPVKGPERQQSYQGNLGGTVVPQRASFSVSAGVNTAFDTPIVNVAVPGGGTVSTILDFRRPVDTWSTYDLLDYAVTRDHVLRAGYSQQNSRRENLGIGGYDLGERAYNAESHDHELRLQESGPIGRRAFIATRFEFNWTDTASHSSLEAVTIRVLDGLTRGGAQVAGGRHTKDFELGSDLDYIRGIHSIRAGVMLEGVNALADDRTNYLGTYTFSSVAAFDAGQPATFVRRAGNPLVEYFNLNSGAYLQDDIRVREGFTLSPGVRYEVQTHVHDYGNVNPRIGLTWAPAKSGRTTLRASFGRFNNWVSTGTYEQTLRVDGLHQQDISIPNPPFPIIGGGAVTPVANKYLFGDDIRLLHTWRVSAGIDQALTSRVRLAMTYSHVHGTHVLRGENLNAPVNGVRPDPAFANVIGVVGDARNQTDQLQNNLTFNFAPRGRSAAAQAVNWRRGNMRASYTIGRSRNNSDGAFVAPPSGTLATEWAPAANDRLHRWSGALNSQAIRNLTATLSIEGSSGTPYTITTGADGNGDLIFNDRPAAVRRNSLRTTAQYAWRANFTYGVNVGPRASGQGNETSPGRYRISWTVSLLNVTNRYNYTGFSGVMTSEFFRQATAVQNPRKVDVGMNFSF